MDLEVSVVVPCFNCRDALQLTLAGFAAQTLDRARFEVIVVDDGSTDGTADMMASFEAGFDLRYIRQPNAGRSAARNAGILAARAPLVLMNDADTLPGPAFVETHRRAHASTDDLVAIGSKHHLLARWTPGMDPSQLDRLEAIGIPPGLEARFTRARAGEAVAFLLASDIAEDFSRVQALCLGPANHDFEAAVRRFSASLEGFVVPWVLFVTQNVSVCRALLDRSGLFDESFTGWGYEDTELGIRLQHAGARFRYVADAQNFHQEHVPSWMAPSAALDPARNYHRLVTLHPTIDVVLHWRLLSGLIDVVRFNALVADYQRLESAGAGPLLDDYTMLCTNLAEECARIDPVQLMRARRDVLVAAAGGDDRSPWIVELPPQTERPS